MGTIQNATLQVLGSMAKAGVAAKASSVAKEQDKLATQKEGENINKSLQGIAKEEPLLQKDLEAYEGYSLDLVKSEEARKQIEGKREALKKQMEYLQARKESVLNRAESYNKKAEKYGLRKVGIK